MESYRPPKSRKSQLCEFRDSHLGHLGAGPMAKYRIYTIYYKGEGGGFPQVRAVVSLVSLNLPVACPNTKNALVMH
jgi:hypothetical protein